MKLAYKAVLVSSAVIMASSLFAQQATIRVPSCLQYPDSNTRVPCTGVVPVDTATGNPLSWQTLFSNGGNGNSSNSSTTSSGTSSSTATPVQNADSTSARLFINNTCVNHQAQVKGVAGQNLCIGGSASLGSTSYVKAEIYDVVVWSKTLTAAEVMQAEKWARDKYSSAYPWGNGPFRVFHGDSLTAGYGCSTPLSSYPARVAAANGWSFGQWTNLGHVGACWNNSPSGININTEALTDIDPMVGLLGSAPLYVMVWEYFNQAKNATQASTIYNGAIAYLQARRTAGISKLFFSSSIDSSDSVAGYTESIRSGTSGYNAWCDANAANYCDVYIPLHQDTNIGTASACPSAAPFGTYYGINNQVSSNIGTFTGGSIATNSNALTITSKTGTPIVGSYVTGNTGIPAGTYIQQINSATSYTLSASTTSAVSGTLTFTTGDGIHLNDAGYQLLANIVAPKVL